jgi:signal transduction histidine kinase
MQIEFLMRHPLRSLLYIEWILFAVVMALEVSPRDGQMLDPKWLNIGIVVLLAGMGLRLPAGKLWVRILYTIAQIVAVFVAAAVGMRPVGLLFIIVVIRSYLIFDRKYRLWITGGIFALSLITTNLFPYHQRGHTGKGFRDRPAITSPNVRSPAAGNAPQIDGQTDSPQETRRERDGFRWGFVSLFGGILLSLQLLVDRILAEKQAKEELAIANQRIRSYALRAQENGSLQERNRIAREIHDSLGHSLTALNLHLEMAVKLSQAIHELADEFKLSNYVEPICQIDLPAHLPPSVTISIYRIVQEALTNISKYAHATAVTIDIHTTSHSIDLQITDNGRGFIPTNNSTGFGLQGMRERVLSLQGEFELMSAPDRGCQIVASIPFGVLTSVSDLKKSRGN